ncbi:MULTISPECIES: hypothetical protein [Metabacillus]|uniref:Uncharacterized protein n=1 Tax=Metabacillus hrfriensis TaxID=3048891 RepID=A0ACD4RHE1_9BACI|nr:MULTISPECIES: hypothetical protein [Metabacillus]UAL54364.1 hypothetical protein K8L98_11570 [Metabacillus dongyingensis]UOK59614.1 hypothetical protein MGI18_13265 [Bacillus sp. OVS6]USK30681.1 hypothetical protein LIT32_11470 [Bacillus sp. CMF21]WHZ59931.1 hypothetical protein QLQ22_11595 [Metabacillus sp. CT-WN-B3]
MSSITTGPFRVPVSFPGGSPSRLIITLKNHTDKVKDVRVVVQECPAPTQPLFPSGARCVVSNETPEIVICDEDIVLGSQSCRQVFVDVAIRNIYRVTVIGKIKENEKDVEVSVVGSDINLQFHEPTMFFRHEDFVKADDK